MRDVVEEEQLVFHQTGKDETKELWNVVSIPSTKYDELWIHRWISLYIFGKLDLQRKQNKSELIDNKELSRLIRCSSNLIRHYLKNFRQLNLSNVDLTGVDLYRAVLYVSLVNMNSKPEIGFELSIQWAKGGPSH